MATCPECSGNMLALVSRSLPPDEGWWCPTCNKPFQTPRPGILGVPAPSATELRPGPGLIFAGRVEPDGAVSFSCKGIGSPAQARAAAHAFMHLVAKGEEHQEHLRGADRCQVVRSADSVPVARLHDEERVLVPCILRGRKRDPGWACKVCGVGLGAGAAAYRPIDERRGGGVQWQEVRVCPACVEKAPARAIASVRPVLRVLDGGAGGGGRS